MPETGRPDPTREFGYHACAVCAMAVLTLTLAAARPGDPLPLMLLGLAAAARWAGRRYAKDWSLVSSVYLDAGLGLMAADIVAFWT